MKRLAPVVMGVVVLVLGGATGWAIWTNTDLRARNAEVERLLRTSRIEAESLRNEVASLEDAVDEARKVHKKQHRELQHIEYEFSEARQRLRGVHPLESTLAAAGARVAYVEFLPTGDPASELAAIVWHQGDRFDADRSGLYVWRSEQGVAPFSSRGRASQRDLVFAIDVRHYEEARIGPPGNQQVEESSAGFVGVRDVGDVTGDGLPDILSMEGNTGTGGCGVWRVLANRRDGVEQIYRRDDCELSIEIRSEMLRVDSAIYPKGCTSAHGCGRRRTWFGWDGFEWERLRSRVLDRY